jgi:hypothetical protein
MTSSNLVPYPRCTTAVIEDIMSLSEDVDYELVVASEMSKLSPIFKVFELGQNPVSFAVIYSRRATVND